MSRERTKQYYCGRVKCETGELQKIYMKYNIKQNFENTVICRVGFFMHIKMAQNLHLEIQ